MARRRRIRWRRRPGEESSSPAEEPGGHLYPALAIARALVKLEPRSIRSSSARGAASSATSCRRPSSRTSCSTCTRCIARAVAELADRPRPAVGAGGASALARASRAPRFVVGTGGYAAGATHDVRRAPPDARSFIQEQNSFPGRTVRAFSRLAREIYLGFPEGGDCCRARARARAVFTGNPIEPPPAPLPSESAGASVLGARARAARSCWCSAAARVRAALNAAIERGSRAGFPPTCS